MALTFGKKNQRIRQNLRTHFLGDNLQGPTVYADFCFRDIDNTNYVTGIYLFSGTRPELSDYSNTYNNWHGNGYLYDNANCVAYWEFNNASSVYPYYTTGYPASNSYVSLGNSSIRFSPSYLNRKVGTRNGTITYYVLQTRYSSNSYGMLTGTVGVAGSGADMIVQIVDSVGNVVRDDTYLTTTTYIECPRGLVINAPQPPKGPDVPDVMYWRAALRDVFENPSSYSTQSGDYFGTSLSVHGNYAVIGAPQEDDAGGSSAGKAYIYDIVNKSLRATLNNPTMYSTSGSDYFGQSVGISSAYVVVGAPYEDYAGQGNSGAIYIFNTSGGHLRSIGNPRASSSDYFGWSVDVDGTYAIVGAYLEDLSGSDSGRAYIYDVTNGNLLYELAGSDTSGSDHFGYSVAISGNYAIVGARYNDAYTTNTGSAYVFNVTNGSLVHTIHNPSPDSSDHFGEKVAIDGNYFAVAAPLDDTTGSNQGSVYVYNTVSGNLLYTISNPNIYNSTSDQFGWSIAINESAGYIMVSSIYEDTTGYNSSGTTYIFNLSDGSLYASIENPNWNQTPSSDYFGYDLGITTIDGKPIFLTTSDREEASNGDGDSGILYVYEARHDFKPGV